MFKVILGLSALVSIWSVSKKMLVVTEIGHLWVLITHMEYIWSCTCCSVQGHLWVFHCTCLRVACNSAVKRLIIDWNGVKVLDSGTLVTHYTGSRLLGINLTWPVKTPGPWRAQLMWTWKWLRACCKPQKINKSLYKKRPLDLLLLLLPPSLRLHPVSLYGQPWSISGHFEINAPNDDQMALNSRGQYTPCCTTSSEFRISVPFTLQCTFCQIIGVFTFCYWPQCKI